MTKKVKNQIKDDQFSMKDDQRNFKFKITNKKIQMEGNKKIQMEDDKKNQNGRRILFLHTLEDDLNGKRP